ncbi:MAG TPA: hypothetical protein VI612_02160 [Candidatus Nanoarchaeia archaeon]|nr:hypothetical protein [Candidatus Nanoarchaeia archaeon]
MATDQDARKALKELSEGIESRLDYVADLRVIGDVTQAEARAALRKFLSKEIHDYEALIRAGKNHCQPKLDEALSTVDALDKNQEVVIYRGLEF